MNATALLNAFKNRLFASNRTISDNLIVFNSKIFFKIRSAMSSWKILFKTSSLMTDENLCSVNQMSWLIKETSISLSRLKNCIWNEVELTADETTFDLFNWSIFSTCDVLREVTETIFKIENLKTIVLVEEVEVLILIISTFFAVTEELLTKSSLKKHLFKIFLSISYLWLSNQQREDSFKST